LAVRFHHRLVFVHPFPNGNGRWSRMAADLLIVQHGGSRFTWGRANLQTASDVRHASSPQSSSVSEFIACGAIAQKARSYGGSMIRHWRRPSRTKKNI
jgi:fido (protein-threonine AMPylation protein)